MFGFTFNAFFQCISIFVYITRHLMAVEQHFVVIQRTLSSKKKKTTEEEEE